MTAKFDRTHIKAGLSFVSAVLLLFGSSAFAVKHTIHTPPWEIVDVVTDRDPGRMISMSGEFDTALAPALKKSLKKSLDSGARTALLITSPGGVIEAPFAIGKEIVNFADKFYAENGVTTIVLFHQDCMSACTFLLGYLNLHANPQHLEVLLADKTAIVIHGPRAKLNGVAIPIPDPLTRLVDAGTVYNMYLDLGAIPSWLDHYRPIIFGDGEEAEMSGNDFCNAQSGLTTWILCVPTNVMYGGLQDLLTTPSRFHQRTFFLKVEPVHGE